MKGVDIMLPIALGIAGALLAKGKSKDDAMKEVERRADLLDKEYYTTEDVAKIWAVGLHCTKEDSRGRSARGGGRKPKRIPD